MLKIALIYGGIAGAIIIVNMIVGYAVSDGEGFGASQAFGFLIMFVALSLIFIGIKRHRDQSLGGVIKFGPAFLLGLSISLVASIVYVLSWEGYLAATDNAFITNYTDGLIAAKEKAGMAGEELQAFKDKMAKMVEQYANPLYRMPWTFTEIFPFAALISLISALLLRNPKVLPAKG